MAGSINKVILIGNLGRDPEIRRMDNNTAVANFPVATSETFTDRVTGERRETTDWHTIVCWRNLAEFVEKYVKKGMKVYVEGRLKTRSWQDKDNNTRYTTEVLADNIQILNWHDVSCGERPHEKPAYPPNTPPVNPTPAPPQTYDFEEDDDLPF